ncbi:MAG: TrbG/VirB9 family P-type conjugative transfer protein [Novosphingobium sp.]|nr:TrbG/VirB9 family P-type conjugative transfer protein [Novosphingobium sp.]
MRKQLVALVTALAAMAPAALALADDRLVSRVFAEDEVVRIDGRLGVQATISFGENEHIENVAVGDSAKWQITPNKRANLLFVKPLEAGARTNMTVVTDRHTYFFDLVASSRAKPVYLLRFTYPEEEKLAAAKAREERQLALNELEQDLLSGDPAIAPADPATLNFAWKRKGDAELMPSRIYDDGNATYLLWPAKRAIPAILVENEQGDEGPVNYSVRGDTIVIGEVPSRILLRSGKASATLENLHEVSDASNSSASSTPTSSGLVFLAAKLPASRSLERN